MPAQDEDIKTKVSSPVQKPSGDLQSSATPATTRAGKEQEPISAVPQEAVKEITQEVKIPPEVEKAGVTDRKETVEIPPDVAKLGVRPSGAAQPVIKKSDVTQVVLPISDIQIIAGTHSKVTTAIRWLSEWCLKKLKKAHIVLKVIHGKVVRMRE